MEFVWAPLKEGFKTTFQEIKDEGPRQLTEIEKQLADQIGALNKKTADSWQEFQRKKNGNPLSEFTKLPGFETKELEKTTKDSRNE